MTDLDTVRLGRACRVARDRVPPVCKWCGADTSQARSSRSECSTCARRRFRNGIDPETGRPAYAGGAKTREESMAAGAARGRAASRAKRDARSAETDAAVRLNLERIERRNAEDLVGRSVGSLMVVRYAGVNANGNPAWAARCAECAAEGVYLGAHLRNRHVSCRGCGARERREKRRV